MSATLDFSIIIPAHNRPRALSACLDALTRLDCPRQRFEVIVVDDGSDPPLAPVARGYAARLPLTLVRQENRGPAAARNAGAARARGRYLAFTDDDCAPAPGWLSALGRHFALEPEAGAGGQTVNALTDNRWARASQELVDFIYRRQQAHPHGEVFFTSNNLALPAAAFHRLGGFDECFPRAAAEDRELCDRWRAHGHALRHVPAAIVHHAHALDRRSFWRQHYTYGRGACRFDRLRRARGHHHQRAHRFAFYPALARHPFRDGRGLGRALEVAFLLAVSQVAHIAGFLHETIATARARAAR